MGKKTKLNLNHLRAIKNFPDKSDFKDLLTDYLNLDEVAKNWIVSQNKINSDKSLRFLKTHNMLGKYKSHAFTNAENSVATIHIVRDPRNVITSLKNHYSINTYDEAKNFLFSEDKILTLSEKEKEKYLNLENHTLPQFIGSWKTHYLSWKNMKKNYLLIQYEKLIHNPQDEFRKISNLISNLIKYKFSDEEIDNAIKLSSFDKLENMEKKFGFTESAMNNDGMKKKFFFLGPKNDWRKILDRKISEEINYKFRDQMIELKYL